MKLPKPMLPLYNETAGFYSCTVPMLEQFFLTKWLSSGEFERNITRIRKRISDSNTPMVISSGCCCYYSENFFPAFHAPPAMPPITR